MKFSLCPISLTSVLPSSYHLLKDSRPHLFTVCLPSLGQQSVRKSHRRHLTRMPLKTSIAKSPSRFPGLRPQVKFPGADYIFRLGQGEIKPGGMRGPERQPGSVLCDLGSVAAFLGTKLKPPGLAAARGVYGRLAGRGWPSRASLHGPGAEAHAQTPGRRNERAGCVGITGSQGTQAKQGRKSCVTRPPACSCSRRSGSGFPGAISSFLKHWFKFLKNTM